MQATATCNHQHQPDDFDLLASAVHARFESVKHQQLFTVDAGDLFSAYLIGLADDQRQIHNCNCCRRFIQAFGNVVTIDTDGITSPAFWTLADVPEMYQDSMRAMFRAVSNGKVTGVFLSADKAYGRPTEGGWSHFAAVPARFHASAVITPHQAMAAKREDFLTLGRGISEFKPDIVAQAVTLLETESLYRSEKLLGPARFLAGLHESINVLKGPRRDNVIWSAVAIAPVGFCTPRSSMIGTLLEDLAAGMPFDDVKRRFTDKMDPLKYQRPQAPASEGNIRTAERLVEALGIAPSLERRHARLDDIQTIWRPTVKAEPAATGVFGHLAPKKASALLRAQGPTLTWEKFARTVLPTAEAIEVHISSTKQNWCGLLTATNPDAPPILQWDHVELRNPVSAFVYSGGSAATQWSMTHGWQKVSGITLSPSMWNNPEQYAHQSKSVILLVEGAKPAQDVGLCLFPEILKSELHQVRSTVEAHSKSVPASGRAEASAAGICIAAGNSKESAVSVRVTTASGAIEYKIDRWD
jgi:hypothetical protein